MSQLIYTRMVELPHQVERGQMENHQANERLFEQVGP